MNVRIGLGPLQRSLAHRDYRRVWSAQVLSELGDWAARVALAVLVYDKTGSRVLTAAVTAVSMLPWLGLGQVLATLGDRFPRRTIMVVADVVRATAFAAMTVAPNVWVILALAFVAASTTPPFEASRAALIPEVVGSDDYGEALAVSNITYQVVILLGYLSGGGLVTLLNPRGALLVNAATFLASAAVLATMRGGRSRPPPSSVRASLASATAILFKDGFLRRAMLLVMVGCSCAMVGEALVTVYVRERIGGSNVMIGLLTAAVPAGTIVAAALVPKRGEHGRQLRVTALVVTIGAACTIVGFLISPKNLFALAAFFAVGVTFASLIPSQTVVGTRVPNERRASVFGLLQGSLMGGQALASIGGGVLANVVGPGPAIALASVPALGYGLYSLVVPPRERAEKPSTEPVITVSD